MTFLNYRRTDYGVYALCMGWILEEGWLSEAPLDSHRGPAPPSIEARLPQARLPQAVLLRVKGAAGPECESL